MPARGRPQFKVARQVATFVIVAMLAGLIGTNLGEPSDVYVYRNDNLVNTDYLPGNGDIRYRVKAGAAGEWRVRAELRSTPVCAAEATFSVGGAPDTDIETMAEPVAIGSSPSPMIIVVGLTGFLIALRWLSRRIALPS